MSYDSNIVVIGYAGYWHPRGTRIEVLDESQEPIRYHDIWGFMTSAQGMWYYLGTNLDSGFSAFEILDPDFDTPSDVTPYWISNDLKSHMIPLRVRPEYQSDLNQILAHLIALSPIKTLYLMARMQPGEDEIVCGTLSLEQFWELHDKEQILMNVCYILKN